MLTTAAVAVTVTVTVTVAAAAVTVTIAVTECDPKTIIDQSLVQVITTVYT